MNTLLYKSSNFAPHLFSALLFLFFSVSLTGLQIYCCSGRRVAPLLTDCHSIPQWDRQSHIKNTAYLVFLSLSLSRHHCISCLRWRRNKNRGFVIPLSVSKDGRDGFICPFTFLFSFTMSFNTAAQRVRGDDALNPYETEHLTAGGQQ